MAEDGEEKLLATVHHIVKTLGRTDTMTEDILKVFSAYDGRLSLDKLNAPANAAAAAAVEEVSAAAVDQISDHRIPLPPSSSSSSTMERTLRALERQLSSLIGLDRLIWSDSGDAEAFLEAMDDLIATASDLDAAGDEALLSRADDLLIRCVRRLEDEFRALIEHPDAAAAVAGGAYGLSSDDDDDDLNLGDNNGDEDSIPIARPVTDFDILIDALPPGCVSDVHKIARRLVSAGCGREAADAYAVARRAFVDESVARLGLRPRSAEEVRSSPWETLEPEAARWIPAFKAVFRILIPSERRLCDRVFDGLAPYGDLAFVAAVRAQALQTLSFADAVAAAGRTPERLFRVVDMYEAVRDLLPETEAVLSDPYSAAIRGEVVAVCGALGSAIKGIFMELENLIRRDPARVAIAGGDLHPITRYVMNYLRAACAFRQTLEEVMEGDFIGNAAAPVDPDRPTSSLAVHIAWIMDVLQKNLETKAKIYPDPALSYIFRLNNGRYIIRKASDNELGMLLGEEWAKQMAAKARRWVGEYQRSTWGKVVSVLQSGGTAGGGLTVKTMQQKLRLFNTYLDEICAVQSSWVLADEEMRADVRAMIAEAVLPSYRGLVSLLRSSPEATKEIIREAAKYPPEEVERRINGLFVGSGK